MLMDLFCSKCQTAGTVCVYRLNTRINVSSISGCIVSPKDLSTISSTFITEIKLCTAATLILFLVKTDSIAKRFEPYFGYFLLDIEHDFIYFFM